MFHGIKVTIITLMEPTAYAARIQYPNY